MILRMCDNNYCLRDPREARPLGARIYSMTMIFDGFANMPKTTSAFAVCLTRARSEAGDRADATASTGSRI